MCAQALEAVRTDRREVKCGPVSWAFYLRFSHFIILSSSFPLFIFSFLYLSSLFVYFFIFVYLLFLFF